MTVKRINAAIAHLGLEIVRGEGYQYFLDKAGNQVGESVPVCYLNHLTLSAWVESAKLALRQEENNKL